MDRYRVKPGKVVKLSEWDPNDKACFPDGKKDGREDLLKLNRDLEVPFEGRCPCS